MHEPEQNSLEDSTTYQGLMRRAAVRAIQTTLLAQGRKRFGSPSPEVETKVKAVADLPRIERMVERIFDVTK